MPIFQILLCFIGFLIPAMVADVLLLKMADGRLRRYVACYPEKIGVGYELLKNNKM